MLNYIELTCILESDKPDLLSAFLISGLIDIGFETFDEGEKLLKAYISEDQFSKESVTELVLDIPEEFGTIRFKVEKIEQQNWNAEWEKNFNPVLIQQTVLIRASFHQHLPEYPYEIIIDPKMSFGTGHHSTTALMIKTMLGLDFKDKKVLDMGCGTGVLAILAKKMGASSVMAIDIDDWAVSNAKENLELNHSESIEVLCGGAEIIGSCKFDIILANINRNILTNDMPTYTESLNSEGILITSGYYHSDLEVIRTSAEQNLLQFKNYLEKNSWIATRFLKP